MAIVGIDGRERREVEEGGGFLGRGVMGEEWGIWIFVRFFLKKNK